MNPLTSELVPTTMQRRIDDAAGARIVALLPAAELSVSHRFRRFVAMIGTTQNRPATVTKEPVT